MFNISDIFSKEMFDEYMPLMLFGGTSMMDLLVLSMIFKGDESIFGSDEDEIPANARLKTFTTSDGGMDIFVPFDQSVKITGKIMGGHSGDLWWEKEYRAIATLTAVDTGAEVWSTSKKGQDWKTVNQNVQVQAGRYQVAMILPEDSKCTLNFTFWSP